MTTGFEKVLTFLARRFVAGEHAEQAVDVAQRLQADGLGPMIDFLGEHVTTAPEAQEATREYLKLLDRIAARKTPAALSVKLSQMGLLVGPGLCLENMTQIVQKATQIGSFVWIDMEGSQVTQRTLDAFLDLRRRFEKIGLCVQACLRRTARDVDRLIDVGASVRLCKGAYKEPSEVAFARKEEVNGTFKRLMNVLFERIDQGVYPAIATHDEAMIQETLHVVEQRKVPKDRFEFQMLLGICNQRLRALAAQGYRTRVYIPYGRAWLPYFLRRLRERKENLYFLARNLFRS